MRGEIQLNVAVNTGIGDGHPQEMPERSITMICQRLSMEHAIQPNLPPKTSAIPHKSRQGIGGNSRSSPKVGVDDHRTDLW